MVNGPWSSTCISCGQMYSPAVSDLVVILWREVQTVVNTIPGLNGGHDEPTQGSIEVSDGRFTAIVPPSWYEISGSIKYYDKYMDNILLKPEYKEAFNYAWYKTTHILYPKYHNAVRVKSDYDKWRVSYANHLKDDYGVGFKDGTQAAVDAFISYMH